MQSTATHRNPPRLPTRRGAERRLESRKTRSRLSRKVARLALAPPHRLDRLFAGLTIRAGDCVLDLGCADAILLAPLARRFPRTWFVGLDADRADLETARARVDAAGLDLELRHGLIFAPPFPPSTFDCVVSAQLLHRLTIRERFLSIGAASRLLRPGGTFHLIDWGPPRGWVARTLFAVNRLANGPAVAPTAVDRLLPAMMRDSGFVRVTSNARQPTPWGCVCSYTGQQPYKTRASR